VLREERKGRRKGGKKGRKRQRLLCTAGLQQALC
jgi:hypothetical protein